MAQNTELALAVLERLLASPIRPTVTTFNAVVDICEIRRSSKCHCGVRQDGNYEHKWRFDIRQYDSKRIRKVDWRNKHMTSCVERSNLKSIILHVQLYYRYAFPRASGKDYGGLPAVKRRKKYTKA
jgi:hypothetical protein